MHFLKLDSAIPTLSPIQLDLFATPPYVAIYVTQRASGNVRLLCEGLSQEYYHMHDDKRPEFLLQYDIPSQHGNSDLPPQIEIFIRGLRDIKPLITDVAMSVLLYDNNYGYRDEAPADLKMWLQFLQNIFLIDEANEFTLYPEFVCARNHY
jgi:hypothetical protein